MSVIIPTSSDFFIEEASIKSLNLEELEKEVKDVKKAYLSKKSKMKKLRREEELDKGNRENPYWGIGQKEGGMPALNSSVGINIANCIHHHQNLISTSSPNTPIAYPHPSKNPPAPIPVRPLPYPFSYQ